MHPLTRLLVFLRLVDSHDTRELSLTNCLIIVAMGLTVYSVVRSGTLDITALVALVTALAAYDRKRARGQKHTHAEKDRAALVTRIDQAEAKLATVDTLTKEAAQLKERMIALSNRVGPGR